MRKKKPTDVEEEEEEDVAADLVGGELLGPPTELELTPPGVPEWLLVGFLLPLLLLPVVPKRWLPSTGSSCLLPPLLAALAFGQ